MTITIQKELADRIVAAPGTKDYGALSIWVQCQCRVEWIRTLPPTAFWPRPKVHSAILHIEIDRARRDRIPDLAFFQRFTRSMFLHRRKFLRSQLLLACDRSLQKSDVDTILEKQALASELRAEQLPFGKMLELCEAVRSQTKAQDAAR